MTDLTPERIRELVARLLALGEEQNKLAVGASFEYRARCATDLLNAANALGELERVRGELSLARQDVAARVAAVLHEIKTTPCNSWGNTLPDEPASSLNYLQHIRWMKWRSEEFDRLCAERANLQEALTKINEIRDSIVGCQCVNFSAHVYPLVEALNSAGFVGKEYTVARGEAETLLERANKLEAENTRFREALMYISKTTNDPWLAQWAFRVIDGSAGLKKQATGEDT